LNASSFVCDSTLDQDSCDNDAVAREKKTSGGPMLSLFLHEHVFCNLRAADSLTALVHGLGMPTYLQALLPFTPLLAPHPCSQHPTGRFPPLRMTQAHSSGVPKTEVARPENGKYYSEHRCVVNKTGRLVVVSSAMLVHEFLK
jgi:hypothetical protein